MNLLEALVLGIVEGVTEYLPVSSTGHLILAAWLLGLDEDQARRGSLASFEIIIQGGAILAVLGLYRERVARMLASLLPGNRDPASRRLVGNLFLSFLPAALVGLAGKDWIKARLFHPEPVVAALILGGVLMVALAPWQRRKLALQPTAADPLASLSWRAALAIGLIQCAALWPGTSRSMVTIVAGILVGLPARSAAEYSFLLALPVLGGACVVEGADVLRAGPTAFLKQLGGPLPVAVGVIAATASAWISVRFLVAWLSRSTLAVFGWWRILLGAALAGAAWSGLIHLRP